MNTSYDCVAIWVGGVGRSILLDVFREAGVRVSSACANATALFYYRDQPKILCHSALRTDMGELGEYMDNKCFDGEIETYTIIDYPRFMKEIREEMLDGH